MYDAAQIVIDCDILQMIICKSQIPINIIIELYATFTRSIKEILSLLKPTPLASSKNPNPILCSLVIIYFGGPLKKSSIMESPCGYSLTFSSNTHGTMSI